VSLLLQVIKKTALYCTDHQIPFPSIDFDKAAAEPQKEVYVFRDENNPEAPIVIHLPLVNLSYREYKAPGEPTGGAISPSLVVIYPGFAA